VEPLEPKGLELQVGLLEELQKVEEVKVQEDPLLALERGEEQEQEQDLGQKTTFSKLKRIKFLK